MAREEKLQRAKEKLFQAKKKEENPKINLDKAIKEWLLTQEKRVEGGDLAQSSYENKFNCINWVKNYFKNKKITITSQINQSTFDDYVLFRLRNTDKRIVIQREISVIKEFFKTIWLSTNMWKVAYG